jgi:phage shock protein A
VLKKWWNYIKAWFTKKSNEVMDPEIEIEQAIQDARRKD